MPRNIPYDYQSIAAPTDPAAGVRRVYYDSTSGQMMVRSSSSQSRPLEGPLIKSGTPVDGDFVTPYDGLLAIDTATKRLYIRVSGSWVPVNADLTSLLLNVLTLANPGRPGTTFTAGNTVNNEDTITMAVYRGGTNLTRFQVNSSGQVEIQPGGDSTFTVGTNKMVVTASSGDTSIAGNLTVTGTALILGTNPSATGLIRIPNAQNISARNAANSADIALLSLNASNKIVIVGQTPVTDGDLLTVDAATTGGVKWATPVGQAPTTADYLTGTAQGGLSAEIVVGTTPGGELGGTWASPTVDATHSGSAHLALATNAILLSTTAAAGAAGTTLRSNDTIAAFDATAPVTQAFADVAATGSIAFAPRRDHKHGMPDDPVSTGTNYHRYRVEPLNVAPPNTTVVGTGSALAYSAGRGWQFATGATNPSSAGTAMTMVPSGGGGAGDLISKVRRIEIQAYIADVLANSNGYIYITDQNVNTAPSGTARHFGIKNLNGTVSFTTADGTTEQTTAITTFVTAATVHSYVITFDGTTVKCYIDGTVRATHATNVPAAGGVPVLRIFIDNNSTANSRFLSFMVSDALLVNS